MCTPAMRRRLPRAVPWLLALICAILLGATYVRAADKPEESPIRAAAKSFVEAFDRGDAKAVAAHWTENGSLVDDQGRVFKGRKAIEEEYAAFFKAIPGVKIIGWDPQASQIRSWSFDSSGGHGTGLWTAVSEGWRIETTGTLADGTLTSSRDLLIRVPEEENVLGWRSYDRRAGQVLLPATKEIVLDRAPEKR